MHAHDHASNRRIFRILGENTLKPSQLLAIKLLWRRAVERNEVNPSTLPAVVSVQPVIFRIVFQPLLPQFRPVQPVGKLQQIIAATFWRVFGA